MIAVATASAVAMLSGCKGGSSASGTTATSTEVTTTTVATTTTFPQFPTLTNAPDISVAAPSCKLSLQGATVVNGSINLVLTSHLPLATVQVDYRFGAVDRRFTMKTDGNGLASHPLNLPKTAAGVPIQVTAVLQATNATCSTTFVVR
jgi:hypothetical protein